MTMVASYLPPRERDARRSTRCECGGPKPPGRPTCDVCWQAAPHAIRAQMVLTNERVIRRRAMRQLLHFAHRRKGWGL